MAYTANDIRNISLLGHGGDGKSAPVSYTHLTLPTTA